MLKWHKPSERTHPHVNKWIWRWCVNIVLWEAWPWLLSPNCSSLSLSHWQRLVKPKVIVNHVMMYLHWSPALFLSVFDEFLGDEGKPPSPDELPYLLYPYVPEPRSDVMNQYPMPHWDLPWANAEANDDDDEGPRMWDGFLQNPLLVKVSHLLQCNLACR